MADAPWNTWSEQKAVPKKNKYRVHLFCVILQICGKSTFVCSNTNIFKCITTECSAVPVDLAVPNVKSSVTRIKLNVYKLEIENNGVYYIIDENDMFRHSSYN